MLGLIGRRLLYLVPVVLAVTILTFLIANLLPGDLAVAMLGDQATPENVAALHRQLGLDLPLWQQYLRWLGGVLSGDLGTSHRTGETVLHAIAGRLPVSLELLVMAELGGIVIGVPLAILCAVRPGSAFDRAISALAFGILSVPPFLLAILLDLRLRAAPGRAAGHGLCAVLRGRARQSPRHDAARRDAGAAGMAGNHARAAQRHDLDAAGGLHRHGAGQGPQIPAHPAGACAEAFLAHARHGDRPQYRPADRRRGDHRS